MKDQDRISRYADLLDLPHPVSKKHPQMALADRAAQFSPFAALVGYDDMIREMADYSADPLVMDQMLDEKQAIFRTQGPEVL